MRRRDVLSLLGGAAVSWPVALRAQQPAMPVIGFLAAGSPSDVNLVSAFFRQGLTEGGYVEGENLVIEYRWAEGHYDRLPALAGVNRQVAVIATGGGDPAALAASPRSASSSSTTKAISPRARAASALVRA